MSDLARQLDSLLRRYAAESDTEKDDQPWTRFRNDLQLLIAEHGAKSVDAALDEIPDGARLPVSLH